LRLLRITREPELRVIRLSGGVGLVVTRKLSSKRAVVRVQSGQESTMIGRTKPVAAVTAVFFLVALLGDAAHAQSARPVKVLRIFETEADSGGDPGSCSADEKFEPAAQHAVFAGPPYARGRSADPQSDPCRELPREGPPRGGQEERIEKQLLALGRQGETIQRARDQVLTILEAENGCAAWFQEADPDPAGTFRSVDFALEENGPSYVYAVKEVGKEEIFKHPHVASSWQNAGRNATIRLNANGAFFKRTSFVLKQDRKAGPLQPGGMHMLRVGSFPGSSAPAQVTALLHEFGHIVGRLPEDDDSWNGQSRRNTDEVLRHCRPEIRSIAKKPPRQSKGHEQETARAF